MTHIDNLKSGDKVVIIDVGIENLHNRWRNHKSFMKSYRESIGKEYKIDNDNAWADGSCTLEPSFFGYIFPKVALRKINCDIEEYRCKDE